MDQSKIIELRYQLWGRLCALADEAMSIADAWWEIDPELVELHYRRCGLRKLPFDAECTDDFTDTGCDDERP